MKFKRILIIISLIAFGAKLTFAQQFLADSLINVLDHVSGKEKVDVLGQLSDIFPYINSKKAIKYAEQGIELAQKINYEKGLAGCYGSLGYAYINLDNRKAEKYTNEALTIRRRINDPVGIASSLNVLGVLYYFEGDYLKSIEYHLEALKRREEIGDINKIATSYNNIALVNIAIENYDAALEYLNKALKIRTDSNKKASIAIIKGNIGKIQERMGNTDEALKTFFETLEINKQLGNKNTQATSYQDIASVYKLLNENSLAITYYDSALAIYYSLDDKNGISNAENGLAQVYEQSKQYNLAIQHANTAIKKSELINSKENRILALKTLYLSYEAKKNFNKAYDYLKLYEATYEELKNNDKIKKLTKMELDYKLAKQQKEQEEKLMLQKVYIFVLILVVLSVSLVLLVLIKSSKAKKKVNEELNKVNAQLSESIKTKDKFISIIAHDLRGPYQTTLGLSEFLSENFSSIEKEDLKISLKSLNSSLNNQHNLLNDLLKWAELQTKRISFNFQKVDLNKLVNHVFSLLDLSAKKKNINLINKIEKEIFVNADKNMLELVIRNLVTNSIKFTAYDGKVEISSIKKGEKIEVIVEDNGIGIPEEDLKKLFRIDVHYTNKGTMNEEGSGLGLILCKEIIENHEGKIWAESEADKGSKFIFTLPLNTN